MEHLSFTFRKFYSIITCFKWLLMSVHKVYTCYVFLRFRPHSHLVLCHKVMVGNLLLVKSQTFYQTSIKINSPTHSSKYKVTHRSWNISLNMLSWFVNLLKFIKAGIRLKTYFCKHRRFVKSYQRFESNQNCPKLES